MTQPELAEAADVPLRTLKAWEKEKQPDSLEAAVRLASALDVSLDRLAGVREPRKVAPRAPEVVVDGVRYVPEAPHHVVVASDAGSDPGDRPAATPGSDAPAAAPDQTPRAPTRRARRKPRAPAPDG